MVLRGDGFTQWSAPLPILSLLMRRRSVGGLASVDDLGDGSKSCLLSEKLLHLLEYTGKDLKLVRMGVLLREMENENLLDYLDVCLDFIDQSRKEGSVLVHCFVGVSRSDHYSISDENRTFITRRCEPFFFFPLTSLILDYQANLKANYSSQPLMRLLLFGD
ncbi:PREDICTED: uncharacterized protein LOC103326284 isoform X1 [Prunus mume]|uniref:protein-tyrosine-phosphatase n=1 Tax=Prunus mume TaxID=102107 RepID=A0ABM1LMX9_PRUMU|nr:PREDICTED: uncharacterized protein LOC103326284 isoform X1 [Prunus mume]